MKNSLGVISSMKRRILAVLAAMIGVALLNGCGSTRPDYSSYVYPPPPDTARIRLVDIYHSSEDLGRSGWTVLAGESNDNGLREPSGVAFDTSGNIVVADIRRGVCIFDRTTHVMKRYTGGAMRSPVAVAVDRSNQIYVADSREKAVLLLNGEGDFKGPFGSVTSYEMPVGIVLDEKRGRMYVSDSKKNMVYILSMKGDSIGNYGHTADTSISFNKPTHLALDSAGNLYISDVMNFRIVEIAPDGKLKLKVGKIGDALGQFGRPRGVAVDRDNHIWAADGIFHYFQVFNDQGKVMTYIGQNGHMPGQFDSPAGMASDGRFIAIVDQLNMRVQLFEYMGEPK